MWEEMGNPRVLQRRGPISAATPLFLALAWRRSLGMSRGVLDNGSMLSIRQSAQNTPASSAPNVA